MWSKTNEINSALSDARLRLANSTNTVSNTVKMGDDLLNKVSEHIRTTDLQNNKLSWEQSELERKVADAGREIGAQTAAGILDLEANETARSFNNAEKLLQEFGDSYNKYNAAKRSGHLYTNLQDLYPEYEKPDITDARKQEILKEISNIKLLIDKASIFSPITGKYALETNN